MKKFAAVILGTWLTLSLAGAAEPTAQDQKWLQAVESMVAKGETKVSTPKEARVTLLQDWAGKKGYTLKVTKNDNGFVVEVTKKSSNSSVAQK
jgi:hypothetical protein